MQHYFSLFSLCFPLIVFELYRIKVTLNGGSPEMVYLDPTLNHARNVPFYHRCVDVLDPL